MPFIAIALLVAAALGGGVSVAANNSLPGDALWGFKTAVNENVRAALAIGAEAQADWDISAAATRLAEAKELAAKGELNAEAQAALTANIQRHAEHLENIVAKLQAAGKADVAADIAARFQAQLAQRHSAIASASQDSSVQASIAPFLSQVRSTLDAAANLSASASANAAAQGSGTANGSTGSANGNVNASGSASTTGGNASSSVNVQTGTGVEIDL